MRVIVAGLRGFPGVQGGVEKHAEHLYPLLKELGCEVEVVVRPAHLQHHLNVWNGVALRRLWSPGERIKGLEAMVHTLLGIMYASLKRPDIIHIHAVGPALFTPFARLLGLRVVFTHHGEDYEREKWGPVARLLLRVGERMGICFSSQSIVISKKLMNLVRLKYARDPVLIPNGVTPPLLVREGSVLKEYGLKKNRYILMVSRFVPEKRHLDLLEAFAVANLPDWRLVLVGSLEPRDSHIQKIMNTAEKIPGVVFTGFQTGRALDELYTNAGVFVLPSSHEGLPIVILEALSYGVPVLASDISPNLEVGLPQKHYFPLGEVESLAKALELFSQSEFDQKWRNDMRAWVTKTYDWKLIAHKTHEVYRDAIG